MRLSFLKRQPSSSECGIRENNAFDPRTIAPPLALLIFGISGLSAASLFSAPANGQYIIITAPGSSLADTFSVVQAAQGGIIRAGRHSNMVIAASSSPDFAHAARRAGAWLVINPTRLSGCYGEPSS